MSNARTNYEFYRKILLEDDLDEEERIEVLDEMDDLWWEMTPQERDEVDDLGDGP